MNFKKIIDTHKNKIPKMLMYRYYSKNQVGVFHKDRIIKNLRLQREISNFLNSDGTLTDYGSNGTKSTRNFLDLLVEDTLPKASIETLKKFSIGEKPLIIVKDKFSNWVNQFELRENIHNKIKKIVHDMLVVGDAFFKIENKNGKAKVILLKKENIALIPDDWNRDDVGAFLKIEELENKKIRLELYEDTGKIKVFEGDGESFVLIEEHDTHFNDFNIHQVKGVYEEEDSLYSNSIFEGLTSSFIELTTRITANSFVFNKYMNPKKVGASDFSEIDTNTGERIIVDRDYYFDEEPTKANALRYITPPTDHITTSMEHFQRVLKNAYSQLGVNEISLGISATGGIASGEAFKKAITPTLNTCRDISNNLYVPLINLYKQAYQIETGQDLQIEIIFQDGITLSEKERIENEISLVESKIISRTSVLKQRGVTNPIEELRLIAEEDKILNSMEEIDL